MAEPHSGGFVPRRRKRTDVRLNLSVMMFDVPMASPKLVRDAVWDVVKSRQREQQLFGSIMATVNHRMALPGYMVKQDGRTHREGK